MTQWRRILPVAIAALLIGGVLWQVLSDDEPTYQGKRLSVWLAEAYPWNPGQTRETADATDAAVRAIGKPAVPGLLRMIQRKDLPFTSQLIDLAEQQSWVNIECKTAMAYQWRAVQGFRILGPEARDAFPELRQLFWDPKLAFCVGSALAEVSPDAVPILRSGLTNPNPEIQFGAAHGLQWAETAAWVPIPELLQKLDQAPPEVQRAAAWRLGFFGREPATVLPALLQRAQGEAMPGVRGSCIHAIGCFSNQAVAHVPALLAIRARFGSTNEDLDWEVTHALKKIDPGALDTPRPRPAAGSPTNLSPVGPAFQPAGSGGFPAPSTSGGPESPPNRQPGKAALQDATLLRATGQPAHPVQGIP